MIIRGRQVDAKLRYKAKKVKIVFFDIDDTLRAKETGLIPESVKEVFHQLKKKRNPNRDCNRQRDFWGCS